MTEKCARWYLRIFGLVYGALAMLGFAIDIGGVNMADHLLHAILAVVLLAVSFGVRIEGSSSISAQPNRKGSTL